jgi:hypothetical protein
MKNNWTIIGILIGLGVGIGGGLFYAWVINPVRRPDAQPWQLDQSGKRAWIIAASVGWMRDNDLLLVADRLNDLRLNETTFQRVADLACDLARSSYAQSDSGLVAIRAMVKLAEGQGKRGCAADLIQINTPIPVPTTTPQRATPTLIPVPTKTPTPEPGLTFTPATAPPSLPTSTGTAGKFIVVRSEPYCNVRSSGVIEVLVTEANGTTGVPGVTVLVEWAGGSDRFYTGLKPNRDAGFADFKMTENERYTVTLPGLSDPSNAVIAQPCTDRQNGGTAITSYRLYFRRTGR